MNLYKSILYIEDLKEDRDFFKEALQKADPAASLVMVSNANAALSLLAALPAKKLPQIIFLDLTLPGVDGLTFLEALNATQKYARIPVVVLALVLYREQECEKLGAVVCIEKPPKLEGLYAILDNLLHRDVVEDTEELRHLYAAHS